jgi:Trypsin-co-occurring domain 1
LTPHSPPGRTCPQPLQKITQVLRELAPEEAQVEFGLKIGGETGVIVAKGAAEVNFVVRMTWKTDNELDDMHATRQPTAQTRACS